MKNEDKKPKVSIIMGVYNCEKTLKESIDSILAQTYKNWELIICDDGSGDNTFNIVKQYAQAYPNICLIKNDRNRGLTYTLNNCLKYCKGEFIARQDGDDRSHPERLQKEIEVLLAHPEYAIVSTATCFFDEIGFWGRTNPVEKPQPKDLIRGTPHCHAPCMIRREAIMSVGGYDDRPRTLRVEDYDLWFRMYARGYRGYNIQEVLYEVRDDVNAYHRRRYIYRINGAYVRYKGFRLLGLPLWSYVYALKPLVVGLVPDKLYKSYRKKHYGQRAAIDV